MFLLGILLLCKLAFSQWDVEWIETSFSDFADGEWDLSLYVSHRANLEGDSGAVEWTPRYDLDLNGYPDLVSSDYAEGVRRIRVWYMGPSGLDSSRYLQFYDAGGANDIADLNCDGYPELIQSGFGYNFVLIFWNNEGRFDDYDTTMLGPHNNGEGIYVADYDKDGYLDIALTDEDGFRIYWGSGGGEHGWRCVDDTIFLLGGTHYNIEAADIDRNGYLDLLSVCGRSSNGPLYIFRNYGARIFVVDSVMLSDAGYGSRKHGLSVGDIDRDGDIDVIATSFYSSSAVVADVFLNEGSGDFTDDIVINPGACHGGCDILDFDGDGWLDILFFRGIPEGYLKVYFNTALYPWFDDGTTVSVGPFPVDASGGIVEDINCDGYFDIFVDNMGDNSYVFWGPSFSDYENLPVRQDHHGMFRDPGNIGTKEPSAYYISNVFDVGGTVCRGEVNWVAYDSLVYDGSGYLPYPVGSYIVILGRSGDSPTIDATWTDWDTLRNGEELPSSLVLKRYFQYQILFNYRNTAYLPWLESIEFSFDTCETDTNSIIDSVWFSEETDCNDSNIVEICYIVSGSTYIQIQISSDSGEIWLDFGTDWFSTFFDTAGDIGYVDSGLHCFYWVMSTDYPGVESDDWSVRIINTSEISQFYSSLDSREPDVNIICPDSGVMPGNTIELHWSASDMFLENENTCSLIVSYCSMYEDTLELSDTVFGVAVDSSPLCNTVCFEIFVRDSFCNYGYNRCCTPILNPHLALRLLTPPSDSIIACDDQEIIFKVQYNSDCLPLDSVNTYLIIDSTDTFTLDSIQLNFEPSDSLLRFSPGSGYWHSGYHFFQIHIQDNCGNAIDSLFSALFDTESPTAYIVEPSTNDTFSDFPLLMSGNIQRIVITVSDDISGIRPDSIIFVVSEDTIPFHHMKY